MNRRRFRGYHRDKSMTHDQRKARQLRNFRMGRIYLLSLQSLPVEKLEQVFRKVRDGELGLIGLREEPRQHIEPPNFKVFLRSLATADSEDAVESDIDRIPVESGD